MTSGKHNMLQRMGTVIRLDGLKKKKEERQGECRMEERLGKMWRRI